MAVTSRWSLFDKDATTAVSIDTNQTISGTGTQGYVESASAASDVITISGGVADQLQVNVDSNGFEQITLTSGSAIDARQIAKDITYKLKQLPNAEFENLTCEYQNNKFRIYSSSLGTTSTVAVDNGGNDCLHLLGMAATQGGALTVTTANGQATTNNASYTGQLSVSGTYKGQFDDVYTVMIGSTHPVGTPSVSGTYAGTATATGDWNESVDELYTVTIDTSAGTVMNGGTGNVPTFTVTSDQGDNIATATELLYADKFYEIGTKGLRVKFTDAPFGNGDTVQVQCTAIATADGVSTSAAVGAARYIWSSFREGKSSSFTTTSTVGTALGTKGLTVAWSASGNLTRRDEFRVIASGPQPSSLNITTVNFGSVTISTYSEARVVWFELMSGATILTNTKFGLNSHGTAQHHNEGNSDTLFAFGTGGEATPASDGSEWHPGVVPSTDLASDVPPAYLAATEDNLSEVTTAGASETIGVAEGELVTDFIYLAVKLGASETGSNADIRWRMFFDFA